MKLRSKVWTPEAHLGRARITLARELIKLAIILIYTGFATAMLITTSNPLAFIPLLSWALWQRA
jgi:hypothetical protein